MLKKKPSLVVLQSWSDCPPKIKGIAPEEDERPVKLEPDHKGHFLTQEITDPELDPRFVPRGRTFSIGSWTHENKGSEPPPPYRNGVSSSPEPQFIRKNKVEHFEKNPVNRHSYGGFYENNDHHNGKNNSSLSSTGKRSPMGRSISNSQLSPGARPETLTIRPDSVGTNSPDQQDASSLEYTPPSSPVSGRYRNLGPELSATIPKRAIKSNWITGIKSRWITTHPDSGRSTLKSYSSSPSLVALTTSSSSNAPFFNPLYKLTQQRTTTTVNHFRSQQASSAGSSGSTSGIVLSADDDSDRSRSSLSNPVSFSPSPPPPPHNNNSPVTSLRQQIVYNSSRPNGLQKYNSLTDFSEEDLFCGSFSSGSGPSPFYGHYSSPAYEETHQVVNVNECVLVEVIRKAETPPANNGGRVGAKNLDKRHSIGELEPEINNKFAGVKVEGSPGKVARIKEGIKRFGRFGRNQSEKILRFQADTVVVEEQKQVNSNGVKVNKPEIIISTEKAAPTQEEKEEEERPVPTTRKRSTKQTTPESKPVLITSRELKEENSPSTFSPQPQTSGTNNKGIQSSESIDISSSHLQEKLVVDKINDGHDFAYTHHNASFDIVDNVDESEERVSSLISDQDRSISCHIQSVPTIDIETFHVHSASLVKVSTELPIKESQPEEEELLVIKDSEKENEMFRRHGRGVITDKVTNSKMQNASIIPGMYSGNVQAVVNQLSRADSAVEAINTQNISHGKSPKNMGNSNSSNGIASVQVPVQAINRNVLGYPVNNIYANSVEEDERGSGSPGSASSDSRSTDFEWHRSSTRTSFRGWCEGLLVQDEEKVSIQVPEVGEASINFENEDNSSLDPDDERENSVEYISIADFKVSKAKKLEKTAPPRNREQLPSCVISLDIGSRGSGYSYWIKEEDDCVRIGHVDSGSSCPKSHKLPSWVSVDDLYLDAEDVENENAETTPSFGYQALNRFMSEEAHSHLFWKWRENFNEGSTFPYTLESKANDDELQFTMKSALKYYGKIALDQIASKKIGNPLGRTIFAVTIPSNFNQRARELVRDAAFGTGLVSKKDTLALIEDSCAAGIYAFHAIKHNLSKMNSIGTSYLSVDIGGVYLHSSGYEYKNGKLYQILTPRSQPISDRPSTLFEAELSNIFTSSFILNYQTKYKAGWLKLMTEFDQCKNLYDPLQMGNYFLFVPSSFVDHFRRFTSMEVEDALESSDMSWSRVGALGVPYWKMQRFLHPMMEFIKNYILNILKDRSYEILVLTGGRSGSKDLVDTLKNAVRDLSIDVVVPQEYSAAVMQGSTISLTNLSPRLIIKSPFSIGVGVMTPFIEDEHPEDKRVLRDGKSWCADVWDSLIKVGQDLETNNVVLRRSYVGAQPGQSLLILPLFQSPHEPKFVTEESVKKCCEFKFNSGQRAWQEVELIIKCRPSELLIMAVDDGVTKNVVILDFTL